MKKLNVVKLSLLAALSLSFVACATPEPSYMSAGPHNTVTHRVDNHYGNEYRNGMEALGYALTPFAKENAPIRTNPTQSMNAHRGYGALLDILSR